MVQIKEFFDSQTWTLTYVVWDRTDAVVIDPVLDYEPGSSKISDISVREVLNFLHDQNLQLRGILETHAHADHMSGSQVLKAAFPKAVLAIGSRIQEVQKVFKEAFNLPPSFATDGSQFDRLLQDGETLQMGSIIVRTLFTPGHTPACVCYVIDGNVFTGDALFMPDYGTGRCDFPGGDAAALYRSVHDRIYRLPDDTRVFTGHDYMPGGRALRFESTVGEEKRTNVQLLADTAEEEFVRFRRERDRQLAAPRLLLPSIQVNINAGRLPEPEVDGRRYLKIPIS